MTSISCRLCGGQENQQRQVIGQMLRDWQKKHPGRIDNMFSALQNVAPSHLMNSRLFGFATRKPAACRPRLVTKPLTRSLLPNPWADPLPA